MWLLAIVEPHVGLELGAPLLRERVGAHVVGPFPEQGLHEAFGLAVGARSVGSGPEMPEPEPLAEHLSG